MNRKNSKHKILNYYASFLPFMGGIEQNIYYFAKYSKMQHIVLTNQLHNTQNFERIGGIEVYRVPPKVPPLKKSKKRLVSHLLKEIPREINKIKMLKKINFDIIHLRGPYLSSDLFYGLDCTIGSSFFKKLSPWRLVNKPKIITFHALLSYTKFISPEAESTLWIYREKKSWNKFEKFLCKYSDEIICVDQYMIAPLRELSEGKEIHFIPSAVDLSIFKPMEKNETLNFLPDDIKKSLGRFNVLIIGRINEIKGVMFLNHLSKLLPKSINIIHVGEGKLPLQSSRIIKLGPLANSLLPYLINYSDIVFHPAITEGIGRTALETLACGKPIIMLGKHMNRFPLINGKNGFIVDDPKSAAEIILELHNSQNFYKQIALNAISTSKDFDVRELAGKVDKIYKTVA